MIEWIKFKSQELNSKGQHEASSRFSQTSTQPDMSQTLTDRVTGSKFGNGRPSNFGDEVHVMTIVHKYRLQILLEILLAVTIENIWDAARSKTVDEMANILHREEF